MSARAGAARRTPAEPFVAELARRGKMTVAEPFFERRGRRLSIDGKARGDARDGDLALIGFGKRGARVIRRIGRGDVARDVVEALMLDRGLRRSFPRAVEAEAAAAAAEPPWDGPRKDLIDLPTFTIDPATAKDFDDAISARREPEAGDGAVRVWVHIADVSAYVRPGGALDAETCRRATSVYVPGAVEPMLPEALSNEACSLVPGVPRNAVTVELLMRGPDAVSVAFHRSVIRSDKRLTYGEVDEVFAGTRRAEAPWAEPLEAARAVAAALRDRRAERGALAVTSAEPSYRFDADGHVTGVEFEQATESHELIEHLMILANEQVAGYLADRRAPTLYRVHEPPSPDSVRRLADQLASLDIATPPLPKQFSPQQAGELVGEISRLVAQELRRRDGRGRDALTSLVLRSLKQAYYSPRNVGHAGLQSARYCHFTSPIRRLPDLVAHRALLASVGLDDTPPRAEELGDEAEAASNAEREAMQTERAAADVCRAFLLERTLFEDAGRPGARGEERVWDGEIVGLVGGGAFVRFGEQGFEGFLPARRLRGEWWELNEHGTALVGDRSGRTLRLGDAISVIVGRIETARGRVDLEPAAAE